VGAELTAALKALSQREGVTLFMLLLAAFTVLLARYTGQEDIVVGAPIANRNRAELEGLIGFFVNTLVMRTDLSGDPGFTGALRRVRKVCLGAYAHQDLPFEKLVEELQPERDTSRNPLFQITFQVFNLQASKEQSSDMSGGEKAIEVEKGTSAIDLAFDLFESADEITGQVEYNTDLFEAETVRRMIGHFQILLAGIVADPAQRLSQLPLLSESERRQLLVEWNQTAREYPREQTVQQLFEAQVAQRPEAIALSFGTEEVSYRELNERANRLAHYLQSRGVGAETLVGLMMERSVEMVVGMLGVLKAGAAYLPLDPQNPPERISFMLTDAEVSVLLTKSRFVRDSYKHGGYNVVCLDSDWQQIALHSNENALTQIEPENLVYVIYTSGSTGEPKGVEIQHASLLNLIIWHQKTFQITAADRATHLAGVAFDASVLETWPYLCCGATVYLPEEDVRSVPGNLRDWLVEQRITITFLPTPLAESMFSLEWPEKIALCFLLTGGDKLHVSGPPNVHFQLVNNYGPTENTVVATSTVVEPQVQSKRAPTIGRPISNTEAYVVDGHIRPVPAGVPGELYLGGDGLARGYCKRPDLTAERFIPHPFSRVPGARLYRTGDLVRYLPDGKIEFLGRIDHQVMIRGFRIELGEIETILGEHDAVKECVVIVREEIPNERRLVAYVVFNLATNGSIGDFRRYLQAKLPDYMVPTNFVRLDSLPLTRNGKVDRRALPKPDGSRPEIDARFVAPRTQLERKIAGVWQEILRVEQVGIYDNFFELGGHSLLIVQLRNRLKEVLGVELPMVELFRHPTVGTLAKSLGLPPNTAKGPEWVSNKRGQHAELS
jgi:amino acid adenylation domain-containing protein